MSAEEFDDGCEGCKPVALDVITGRVLPDDDPVMVGVRAVWEATPRDQRAAFHRVCCLSSRDPGDLALVEELATKLRLELALAEKKSMH